MYCRYIALVCSFLFLTQSAIAEIINPADYIKKLRSDQIRLSSNGTENFYSYTERASSDRIKFLEGYITPLRDERAVFQSCDLFRSMSSELVPTDVVVKLKKYSFKDRVMLCVIDYARNGVVEGKQLIYGTKLPSGVYTVIVTQ